MVTHTMGTVLGPIVLGTNINFFLFGIVLYQFSTYLSTSSRPSPSSSFPHSRYPSTPTSAYQRDPLLTRILVWWLLGLDTYSTAICGYMSWQYTIDNFGNPNILQVATWPFSSTPIVTILASVTVQVFLAWRIRIITRRNVYFVIIVVLSIIQGLAGLGTGIGALWVADISRFYQLEPIAGVWFCAQVACDMLITTVLVVTLNRERTGFKHTDSLINRLIKSAVETALFASVFCLLDLAMFFAESGNNLHLAFALPMGRIYSNTLLATLNARQSNRDILSDGGTSGLARRGFGEFGLRRGGGGGDDEKGGGIKVSVTHDIELSPCPVLPHSPSTPPPTPPSSDSTGSPSSDSPKSGTTTLGTSLSAAGARSIVLPPARPQPDSPASRSEEMEMEMEAEEEEEEKGSLFTASVYSLQDVDLADPSPLHTRHTHTRPSTDSQVVFVGRQVRRTKSEEMMLGGGRGGGGKAARVMRMGAGAGSGAEGMGKAARMLGLGAGVGAGRGGGRTMGLPEECV